MAIYKRAGKILLQFLVQREAYSGQHKAGKSTSGAPDGSGASYFCSQRVKWAFREKKHITLAEFLKREFLPFAEAKFKATKPSTLPYYQYAVRTLQDSDFASLELAEISDQHAWQYGAKGSKVSP